MCRISKKNAQVCIYSSGLNVDHCVELTFREKKNQMTKKKKNQEHTRACTVFFFKSTISKVVIISIVGFFFLYKIAFLTTIEIIIISVVGGCHFDSGPLIHVQCTLLA